MPKIIFSEEKLNLRFLIGDQLIQIHHAIYNGRHKIAQFLLKKNADVSLRNKIDETPLAIAAKKGDKALIEMFRNFAWTLQLFQEKLPVIEKSMSTSIPRPF